MFALDARAILTSPDVMFSDQNMQLGSTIAGSDEKYFANIPFQKVFSEGGTAGDRSIIDARCAEVLPISPLDLKSCLKAMFFRSEPERDTLLHLLGGQKRKWEDLCHVSDALKVFQKSYTFVQLIRLTNDGIIFRLNPRSDGGNIAIKIEVWNSEGLLVTKFSNNDHKPYPPPPHSNWIWKHKLADDT